MNFFDPKNCGPMIAAHRGYRAVRPENTLAAFEASLGRSDYIEMDVQMSLDGIPVVHHDPTLGRTCTLPGTKMQERNGLRLDNWTLDELRQLDFGSWFVEADPYGTLADGRVDRSELTPLLPQRIMTLDELLLWRNRVEIPLNIEIKDRLDGVHAGSVVDVVLSAVKKAGCAEQIILSSFNHEYLKEAAVKMPSLLLGALQEDEHPQDLLTYLQDLGVAAYHPDELITTPELIAELRRNHLAVNIWTVNRRERQLELLKSGANSIITDFPDKEVCAGLSPMTFP